MNRRLASVVEAAILTVAALAVLAASLAALLWLFSHGAEAHPGHHGLFHCHDGHHGIGHNWWNAVIRCNQAIGHPWRTHGGFGGWG